MNKDSRILVAGANGMVGRAIVRKLESEGYTNIIKGCLLYTSPSPRDRQKSRMPSSA